MTLFILRSSLFAARMRRKAGPTRILTGIGSLLAAALMAGCAGQSPPASSAGGSSASPAKASPEQLTLKEIVSESAGKDTVEVVAFAPDGRHLAVGAADGIIALYPFESADPGETPQLQKLHAGFTSSIAWSPKGDQVVSAAADGMVRIWDSRTMRVTNRYNVQPNTHPAAVWSPNGQRVAVAEGRDAIQIFSANGPTDPEETFHLPGTTRALLWTPDNVIVGSDSTGKVAFFQPGKADPVRTYQPASPHKAVNSLSLSPTGPVLAVGYDDGAIILIDPNTAKELRQFPKGRSIGSMAWSPNGKVLASSSIEFAVTFWTPQGQQLAKLDIGYDMNGVSWSSDGRYVAAGSDDNTFKIWEVSPVQAPAKPLATPPNYMGR